MYLSKSPIPLGREEVPSVKSWRKEVEEREELWRRQGTEQADQGAQSTCFLSKIKGLQGLRV